MRRLVRETQLAPSQFVLPLFVCPGEGIRKEIRSMPGNAQLSIDNLVREAEECDSLGIGGIILFGIPAEKDEFASGAYAEDGITQMAVRAVKKAAPRLLVITDVCNCEYTSHGHCGLIKNGDVANDETLEWLAKTAVSHARAGADIVVMVHPDYQYDPTLLPEIIKPIQDGVADVVLGSRLMGAHPMKQGMPWWKYISNRFLTMAENVVFGLKLSEYHTGYRAFDREALESVNLSMNSDKFIFDQEIMAQLVNIKMRHDFLEIGRAHV